MNYRLVKVSPRYYQELLNYKQELLETNSPLDGTSGLCKDISIWKWHQTLKKMENKETCPPLLIPAHHYLLVKNHRVYGMVNIRHYLDENLKIYGGHIGYSIRPGERNKGLGTLQLQLALEKCHDLDINPVLIMCQEKNSASAKVITNNGGKLIQTIQYKDLVLQHYLIEVDHG